MKKILCVLTFVIALACVLASCDFSILPNFEMSTTSEETTTTPEETTPEGPDASLTPSVGLAYEVNDDGKTCTITGIGACTDTDLRIGGYINGYKVTSIGDYAFYNCDGLTSVTIGESVTSIGNYAFRYCSVLTSIIIPNSVTSIGNDAFSSCSALTSVTIGDSVTTIGNYAFYNCYRLTSITIPDSVTSIGNHAFAYCSALTSIVVDKDNTTYQSINGNLYSKDGKTLIAYAIGKTDTSFTIPNSVTSIGNYAFCNCYRLTSVTIGESVTSIGNYAFSSCSALTSVTIGDSVTTIGNYAFYNCYNLTSVTIGDSVTTIGNYAFYNCYNLTSVSFSTFNGWWYASSADARSGTALSADSLSNASTAARYLRSSSYYRNYYWFRTAQ